MTIHKDKNNISSSSSSTEGSTMAEHVKLRRPRTQFGQSVSDTSETPSTIQPSVARAKKKNNFSSAKFRGLGCSAATPSQVAVPASRKKKNKSDGSGSGSGGFRCMVVEDVWCGPGIGFSADAASVDCVVARRNIASSSSSSTLRGNIHGDHLIHREHSSCLAQRTTILDTLSDLDSEPASITTRPLSSDVLRKRHYRHARTPSPEGLAEIMLFRSSLQNGGRLDSRDRFSNWRLDVDDMTYEELVELGEKIGRVNTGLKEDEIVNCVTKTNQLSTCSICQECEATQETGKLDCGHVYHLHCIKQWLSQRNSCPVCKIAAK